MTKAPLLTLVVLLLAGCHRGNVADVTLDADRAAENATAAKTLADLAEADKAAGTPLPHQNQARAPAEPKAAGPAEPEPEAALTEGNGADATPQ